MNSVKVWRLLLPMLIIFGVTAFSQESAQRIDNRIWSNVYWQKLAEQGLVPVSPQVAVPPAKYTGSGINALTSLIDDSPDVLIIGGNNTQSENSVFANPNDPNKVLNSNNSTPWPVSGIFGANGLMSSDAGLTWTGSVNGTGGSNSGDPAVAIGLNGEYYNGYIAADGGNGMAYSTNEGASWTHVQVAPLPGPGGLADKNHLWIDNSPSSPHEGNLYASWTDFGGANDRNVVVSRSTNGGRTWGPIVNVTSALPGFKQGVNIKTDSNGKVYAFYTVYTSGGVTDEPAHGMSVSTDGGVTWTTGQLIIQNIRGVRATGVGKSGTRAASFPTAAIDISGGSRDGWLYVVWPNIGVPGTNTGTSIDVYMIRSSDGGTSWSTPIKVNQDPTGLGRKHWMPWITCDPSTGNLSVIFYDDRNVGGSQAEVFVANSLDGGDTWEDFKVSDVSFTPTPIPGLAGGYFGDYLGISAQNGKVYPVWTDNRDGVARAYTSPFTLADPLDPNAPGGLAAYSDFNTPTTIDLTWTDPTELVDGTPINPGDFTIEISRDGAPLASVPGGTESYNDTGLNDGQLYTYELITKLIVNDSTSLAANVSWHAGGSPTPAAPANLAVTADTLEATLTWDDPTTQDDGTPLDDLDSVRVYRNGAYVASVAAGTETYVDAPNPGFTYIYTVRAVDNETPKNVSSASNAVEIYVGSTPDFLVWVGPDAGATAQASGDSIAAALAANGESSFLTNDLFEFGSDLSIYEGVFVVLGIFSDNHRIDAADPEGAALDTYLAGGGRVYVEGGDCFNYDPGVGGYDMRPWFDLASGPDGSGTVTAGYVGVNDLNGFVFPYSGSNNWMDELQPISSTAIWKNAATDSTHGVFNTSYGGRSVAAVMEFGGLDNTTLSPAELLRQIEQKRQETVLQAAGIKPQYERKRNENFVKKFYAANKDARPNRDALRIDDNGGVQIMANNKTDLMAAYLGLFRSTAGDPVIAVNPSSLADTLLVGGSSIHTFDITNAGGALAGDLTFDITLGTFSGWVSFSPDNGTLGGNQTATITVELDATGLAAGIYDAILEITSNDPATPQVDLDVTLVVNDAPTVGFAPDSMSFTLAPASADSADMTIYNTGLGPLDYTLEPVLGAAARPARAKVPDALLSKNMIADIQQRTANRGAVNATEESKATPQMGAGLPPAVISGEEIFGDASTGFSGPNRDRGNIISVTTATTLLEYKQYLSIPSDVEIYFFVYEGDAPTGSFTLKNLVYFPSSGTGEGFYSSGPTNVPLEAGKSYYLGASWGNASVTYYRGGPSGPIPASFGELSSGVAGTTAGFPPNPGTVNSTWSGFQAYYCAITTGAGFLSVGPESGTVAPGDSSSATVRVSSANLLAGTYEGGISIKSNDPLNPDVVMPVTLTVTGDAVIDVTPDTLQFSTLLAGDTETLDIEIANLGTADLTVSSITSTDPNFSADSTSIVVAPLSSEIVAVTFAPTAPGLFSGVLEIASDASNAPLVSVVLSGAATDAPIVGFAPDSMSFTLDPAETDSAEMTIYNNGAGTLEYTLEPVVGGALAKPARAKVPNALLSNEMRKEIERRNDVRGTVSISDESKNAEQLGAGLPPAVISGEEIFGDPSTGFSGTNRDRGNIISVTTTTTLLEYKQYLNIPTDVEIYFFVYEGAAPQGDFTLKNLVYFPSSGTGEGFYSSGPTNVLLEAGKSYYLGASWGAVSVTYYRGGPSGPIPASFGELYSGVPSTVAGFPPNSGTINSTWSGFSAYYCAITTGAGFLSVGPDSGSVASGDSSAATVRVNSENLLAGTYNAGVRIISNDPVTPEVVMPVSLTVTELPTISTSPDSLDFGTLLAGQAETLEIEIANVGNADLTVSSITSTDPNFSANPTSLVIAPLSAEIVEVTFAPTAPGVFSGVLQIASDDPNTPLDTVYVSGEATEAPVASISPDSFDVTLAIGSTATDTLTITNSGNGPLHFNIGVEFQNAANLKVEVLGPKPNHEQAGVLAKGKPMPLSALNDASLPMAVKIDGQPDFEVPFLTAGAGNSTPVTVQGEEIFGSNANVFGPLGTRGRGNLFTVTTTTNLAEHRLYLNPTAATDMWFVVAESPTQVGTYTTISAAQITNAGPGEGWYSSGTVNVTLEAGKYYLIFAQWVGAANYYNQQGITPYPIPASFGELAAAAGWATGSVPTYADPPSPTHSITATAFGDPVAYYQTLVTGGASSGWVSVDSDSGTVPANSSVEIVVTFDPAGLVGGDYDADIVVSTNDPANPELRAHAHMFVVGQPLISVDDVTFPDPVFVNGVDSTEMWVKNDGNGVLSVTDITSDNPVFSVSETAFDVAAFDSASVMVYFAPTTDGAQSGTLTITNNDPANGSLEVNVSATAIPAPSFTIDPDTVVVNLQPLDSTDVPMMIENTGGSPLEWAVSLVLGNSKTVFPQQVTNEGNADAEAGRIDAPSLEEMNTPFRVSSAPWDLLFEYDATAVSGAAGNAGAEFDGQYFYTTRWASNLIHKYEVDGGGNLVLVEEFSIPGVTGLRDLAWDGQYMYGGNAGSSIYQMDFTTKTLVGTIPSPQPVRHIAYNEDEDAFFVGNWSTNIALVNRSGQTVYSIPAATHTGIGLYGSAYDNISPGGPYLWIFDQNGTTTTPPVQTPNLIKQLSLPSGQPTGFAYDVVPDLGNGVDIVLAGGLFISDEIVPGKVVMGGLSQSVPDKIFGYELAEGSSPFIRILDATSGIINPGDVGGFTTRITALYDSTYTESASLEITTNDPLNSSVIVPVTLNVVLVGVEDIETVPTRYSISDNYPNPFNPTTSINFELPQISNVKLVIYNVLGQKVRTLVNERMQAGRYKAVWDARDDRGVSVASGIYIYRFEAENFTRTQKMILLK